jgi:hypothetical protein
LHEILCPRLISPLTIFSASQITVAVSDTCKERRDSHQDICVFRCRHEQVSTMSFIRPKFRAHIKSHKTVIGNERWFRKDAPFLGKSFTVKKTVKRHATVIDILSRAAKRAAKEGNSGLAVSYDQLQTKIRECHPRQRCGSSACPKCARAFQRAKVAAQQVAIEDLSRFSNGQLVLVTIVPSAMTYFPGQFLAVDPLKANRWLKDVLARIEIRQVIIGSIDLGWEKRRGKQYLQLHWHLAMWTSDPEALKADLKRAFGKVSKHERPIDVQVAEDLGFIPYINKLIKLPKLLRSARRQLPELLLLLDQLESFECLFMSELRLSAQSDGIVLRSMKSTRGENRDGNRNEKLPKTIGN